MIKNKINNRVAIIKEAISTDKLVVFAGAGVSKDSGIPLWGEFISEINKRFDEETSEIDPLKVAQMLYNEKGEKEYNDIIEEILFRNKKGYNEIHRAIFDLNPQHIITTNYDYYFENIIENEGLPFSIVSKDEDLPYAKHKQLLIKYHGDFKNHNIVFKEDDYLNFSHNHTLKEVFVKSLFSNKVIVFVGYSVSDPNLKLLIKDVQYILKKHQQKSFILSPSENFSVSEINYFENLGISIINFNKETFQSFEDKIELSEVGTKVFSQINYLKRFKLYEYRNLLTDKSKNIQLIDNLYNSIHRFHYSRVIPDSIFSMLYPINIGAVDSYMVTNNSLKIYNRQLYDLIKTYDKDSSLYNEGDKEKMNYFIERLIYSGVYIIEYVNTSKKSKDNLDDIQLIEKLQEPQDCNCFSCLWEKNQYSRLIKEITKYKIDETTKLWDDLVTAYVYYRLCDFYSCYRAFRAIVVKANRLGQYSVSFIAKYNLKRVKWLIRNDFYNSKINSDDVERVCQEIDSIDLDSELDKLKYFVDEDVYYFLKEIKEGVYIQKLCNEIDDISAKVKKTVVLIENGGRSNNSYFQNLYRVVEKLTRFLEDNFLIGNGYSLVEGSIKKTINTFLLGYYLKKFETYQDGFFKISYIENFNSFLLNLIIKYSDAKELNEFLILNNIKEIEFSENSEQDFKNWFLNFLKCSYSESTAFGYRIDENEYFTSYTNHNKSFKYQILKKFDNFCVITTYFRINKKTINVIFENINRFLEYINFEVRSWEPFLKMVEIKADMIEVSELIKTLAIFMNKGIIDDEYLRILNCVKQKEPDFLDHNYDLEKFNFGRNDYRFPILYSCLSSDRKVEFGDLLKVYLVDCSTSQPYYVAIKHRILCSDDIISKYNEIIKSKLEFNFTEDKHYKKHLMFPAVQYFDLIYSGLLEYNIAENLNIKEPFLVFLSDPENFDSNKFKVEWLKSLGWGAYISRFSRIDYIINALQEYLSVEDNKFLSRFYFKIQENKRLKKIDS